MFAPKNTFTLGNNLRGQGTNKCATTTTTFRTLKVEETLIADLMMEIKASVDCGQVQIIALGTIREKGCRMPACTLSTQHTSNTKCGRAICASSLLVVPILQPIAEVAPPYSLML